MVWGRLHEAGDEQLHCGRVLHDVLAEGLSCGLHRIERLVRENGLRARPRRLLTAGRHWLILEQDVQKKASLHNSITVEAVDATVLFECAA